MKQVRIENIHLTLGWGRGGWTGTRTYFDNGLVYCAGTKYGTHGREIVANEWLFEIPSESSEYTWFRTIEGDKQKYALLFSMDGVYFAKFSNDPKETFIFGGVTYSPEKVVKL